MDTNGAAMQLDARQSRVIDLLLTGLPVTQVARMSGVGRRTIYDWLDDQAFRDHLQERRREVSGRVADDLAELGRLAVAVLKNYLADDGTDPYQSRERVKLARDLLGELGMIDAQGRTTAKSL